MTYHDPKHRLKSDPPLVKGGQGRSGEDLYGTALFLYRGAIAGLVAGAVAFLVRVYFFSGR